MDPGVFAAAAIAPVSVWLLWRVQAVSVDRLLRGALLRLLRGPRWVYSTVSWCGTFLHEVSHAAVLLLSGHGVKQFRAGVDSGHVLPRRIRRGPVGFLGFLAAAMAPMYVPPALVFALAVWLVHRGLWPGVPEAGLGIQPAWDLLHALLVTFPRTLGETLLTLDLATWQGALVFLLVLVAVPGSRPSHVKGSRFHGTDDEGDIAVLRKRIRRNPVPFLVFLALVYGAYFALVPWLPRVYWGGFVAVWSVALTGILLALFGTLWWWTIAQAERIRPMLAWLPFALLVAVQVVPRVVDVGFDDVRIVNAVCVLALTASTLVLVVAAPRRHPF